MPKAGIFAGIVTQNAPANNAPTDKRKGYHWMEYGATPPAVDLTHLIYYHDFDIEATSAALQRDYAGIHSLYDAGRDDGSRLITVAPGPWNATADGMHNDNAALFDGTTNTRYDHSNANPLTTLTPQEPADLWWNATHSISMWVYITQTGTAGVLWGAGDLWVAQGPRGQFIWIDTDGTIKIGIGKIFDFETFNTTAALTLNTWHLLEFTHDIDTKTVGVSLTPSTSSTRNAPEYTVYTSSMDDVGKVGFILGAASDNGIAHPVMDGTRLARHILWDHVVPESEADLMFNAGVGLRTSEFFDLPDVRPAEGFITPSSQIIPSYEWYAPGKWSTYTVTAGGAGSKATVGGLPVTGYRGLQVAVPCGSGTLGAPTLEIDVGSGLEIVRTNGGTVVQSAGHVMNQIFPIANFTVFFCGSSKNVSMAVITNWTGMYLSTDPANYTLKLHNTGGGSLANNPIDNIASDTMFIGAVSYNEDGTTKIYINGALSNTGATAINGSLQATATTWYATNLGGAFPLDGDHGHTIYYNEDLSDTNAIAVMDWMNAKWGTY